MENIIKELVKTKSVIYVSGEAELFSDPDYAEIEISTRVESKIPENALTSCMEKSKRVTSILKQYEREGKIKILEITYNTFWQVYQQSKSYIATCNIKARTEKYDLIGEIMYKVRDDIDKFNVIGKLEKENERVLKEKAIEDALENARDKAYSIVRNRKDVFLGKILFVTTEEIGYTPLTRIYHVEEVGEAKGVESIIPEIRMGKIKVGQRVKVLYELEY